MLAQPLGIELRADLLAHQPLAVAVELDPLAVDLVDQLGAQRRAVPQLDLQPALGPLLVRPVQDQPGGVEAAQRAGAGERQEGILLHLLLGELPGVVGEDHARAPG